MIDDPAFIPLYHAMRHRLIRPSVQGLIINGVGAPALRHVRMIE